MSGDGLSGGYEIEKRQQVEIVDGNKETGHACCRFCQTEFSSEVNEYRHHCKQRDQPPWRAGEEDIDSSEADPAYLLEPAHHEFKAYLKYDFGDEPGDMTPYFGLNSLQKEHDFGEDGALNRRFETEDGEEWLLEFSFKKSGLKPWDHPEFRLSNVREYLIKVWPAGYEDYSDALRSITFQLSPRWPDLESIGDSKNPSNPHDLVGIDLEADGSGIPFRRYPRIFHQAMRTLRDAQGERFDSPTYIEPAKVAPSNLHHSSNVTDAALEARINDDYAGPIYAIDGPIHRLSLLLADDRSGYASTTRDDRERAGHYHSATIGTMRAGEFISTHEIAKEVKLYHMRHPDVQEGPTEDPKLSVSFQHSKNDETLYFHELDSLEKELDEVLLSVLNIADLPLTPDHQVYTEDEVFDASGSRRLRKVVGDEVLPRLEMEQEAAVETVIQNASTVDAEIWEELVTDGGEVAPKDLAERLGRNLDHVYRRLQKMSDALKREYGKVSFASRYVAQNVWKRIDQVQRAVQANIEGAVGELMDVHQLADDSTWWGRLRNQYGAKMEEREGEDWGKYNLEVEYEATDRKEAAEIAQHFAHAYPKTDNVQDFLREVVIRIPTIDGPDLHAPIRTSASRILQIG